MTDIHSKSTTFVLVHGASHGGWCYSRVADLLRSQGHRVFTPTLSGLAERATENAGAANLTTHINNILDVFKFEELDDVVLCGHSYGGMVISGAADRIPEKIRNLVYIDAVIPESGKSMANYVFPGDVLLEVLDLVGTKGGGLLLPAPPAAFFAVNEADQSMVDRLMTPHPMASLLEKIEIGDNINQIKSHTYIHATKWGFEPTLQQYRRSQTLAGWSVFEVDCGHDIMIDAPGRLAQILLGLDLNYHSRRQHVSGEPWAGNTQLGLHIVKFPA